MGDNFDNASKDEQQDMLEALSESETSIEDKEIAKQEKKEAKKQKKLEKKAKKKIKKNNGKEEVKPEDINIVKDLLSLIVYIGIVVLVCYLIVTFVGCRSKVDGNSMNPTLDNGDNLWVDKFSYEVSEPKRFDVIIFNYDENTTFVKRIIGLPGETVRIDQHGTIFINEKILEESYGNETILPTNIGRASQSILLGEDEYFVLGDNRNNSQDSRMSSVGNVEREDIVGKAVLRIYPLSKFGVVK